MNRNNYRPTDIYQRKREAGRERERERKREGTTQKNISL